MELISSNKCFGGWHKQYSHFSSSNQCQMRFAVFLPPQAAQQQVPVLYWLSGLTCTDENFMQKAGAMQKAAELGIAIVAPDTSPRGEGVPDDENGSYDFGLGAGFYVNATQPPWDQHYHMYDYVVQELPELVEKELNLGPKRAISGHSMGGHGALMIALRNAGRYSSVSAFSPITNPTDCPWGIKAFTGYLGEDQQQWQQYDSSVLMTKLDETLHIPALVDQGSGDNFVDEQLKPERLKEAARISEYPLNLRIQPDYDHSYYFISSFIDEHLAFHHSHLTAE